VNTAIYTKRFLDFSLLSLRLWKTLGELREKLETGYVGGFEKLREFWWIFDGILMKIPGISRGDQGL
jgi:hypothetical protein